MKEASAIFSMMSIAGDALTLFAYYMLQSKKLSAESPLFLSLNCLGSSIILIPLLFHSSLALILDQVIWFSISVYGVVQNAPQWFKSPGRRKHTASSEHCTLNPRLEPDIPEYTPKKAPLSGGN